MEDSRKKKFRINLEDILGDNDQNRELDSENTSDDAINSPKSQELNDAGAKTVHDDVDLFITWFRENALRTDFDQLTARLILEKHLSNPNLTDDQRATLLEFKNKLSINSEKQTKSLKSLNLKKVALICLLTVFGIGLLYLLNEHLTKTEDLGLSLGEVRLKFVGVAQPPPLEKLPIDLLKIFLEKDIERKDSTTMADTNPSSASIPEIPKNASAVDNIPLSTDSERISGETKRSPPGADRADSGSPTPKYPFEAEVVVSTPVLSSPSLDGVEVGFLEAGAIALVVGESGSFYRISSRDGRDGFILKQDVSQANPKKERHRDPNEPVSPFSREAVDPNRRD